MCGQYYCDSSTFSSLEDDEVKMSPGQDIPVFIYFNDKVAMTKFKWGYSLPMKNELIINARCETLFNKKIFQSDIKERRCVIPAKGFYQKDSKQHRVSFESQVHQTIYMAGIYRAKEKEVVIITTKANHIMQPIHDRMPLIIPKDMVKIWLSDNNRTKDLLQYQSQDLKIVSGYMQQTLF